MLGLGSSRGEQLRCWSWFRCADPASDLPGARLRAQTAVGDSAEFAAWRQVQKEDIDGLRKKFMALAKAVPADKLVWRPMEGTRSFREVFAHIAAEGNTETAMFGRPLPAGSLADFHAEEARLKKLPDD